MGAATGQRRHGPAADVMQRLAEAARDSRNGRQQFDRDLRNVAAGPIEYSHYGVVHRAEIVGDAIVLADGRRFFSPTSAARAVNGDTSVNGWKVWKRDGRTLADLHG